MIDAGCAVALATDLNPGSCFSGSIPLVAALAGTLAAALAEMVTDGLVAAVMARGAVMAAVYNVRFNVSGMKDRGAAARMSEQADRLARQAESVEASIRAAVPF